MEQSSKDLGTQDNQDKLTRNTAGLDFHFCWVLTQEQKPIMASLYPSAFHRSALRRSWRDGEGCAAALQPKILLHSWVQMWLW